TVQCRGEVGDLLPELAPPRLEHRCRSQPLGLVVPHGHCLCDLPADHFRSGVQPAHHTHAICVPGAATGGQGVDVGADLDVAHDALDQSALVRQNGHGDAPPVVDV